MDHIAPVEIIDVRPLFPELNTELLNLLYNLSAEEWTYKTTNPKWLVKDIVAHLLDTDLRRLSVQRDDRTPTGADEQFTDYQQLLNYLNHLNNIWIESARRLSPGVLMDLLTYTGSEIPKLYNSLNLNERAKFCVAWAGETVSNNWFDIAREYTEKWYHQQQIREAVGRPLLLEEKWLFPLIDTFVRGLANIYQKAYPSAGNEVVLVEISDIKRARWILKKNTSWELFTGETSYFTSKVVMNADTAWRLFSKNISKEEAATGITIEGDNKLGYTVLELTAYMK